jgi:hypothetical protein
MAPQTIEEIIARLEAIIDEALRGRSRIGYFAALYERVTSNVRRALVAGDVFQNNPRMERLDVIFAGRFLDAWDAHVAGREPTASWRVAFSILDNPGPLVVQHLMLGMNAHINLDLGVVELELGQICPRFSRAQRLTFFAPHLEEKLFGFGMGAARDLAWLFAEQIVAAGERGREHVIAKRDAETAVVGQSLYPLHGFAGRVARWIHTSECRDIRFNIQIIAE